MSVDVIKLGGNCMMWSDVIEASNCKWGGDDVRSKLRRVHGMGIRRGGMWGEMDRRSLKGVKGKEACPERGAKEVDVRSTVQV